MRLLCLGIVVLFVSGCVSWVDIKRDDKGQVEHIEYSNGQKFSIGDVSGDAKIEWPTKEIVTISGLRDG